MEHEDDWPLARVAQLDELVRRCPQTEIGRGRAAGRVLRRLSLAVSIDHSIVGRFARDLDAYQLARDAFRHA